MSITIDKLKNENKVVEEACVKKDEELLQIQFENDQKLSNLHQFSDKLQAENDSLRDVLSNLNHEISELKARESKLNKVHKPIEKEIHNLDRNLDNMRDTIRNLKTEKVELKSGKAKAEANLRRK